MRPAYSSVSTIVSWSQMNSSCCRGTENSGFWKELSVVCEEVKSKSTPWVKDILSSITTDNGKLHYEIQECVQVTDFFEWL